MPVAAWLNIAGWARPASPGGASHDTGRYCRHEGALDLLAWAAPWMLFMASLAYAQELTDTALGTIGLRLLAAAN